jgi:hypothetical protein
MADMDMEDAHRGGKKREGLLQPEEPETPYMPMWQNLFRYILESTAILSLAIWATQQYHWFGMFVAVFAAFACWRIFNVRDDPSTLDVPCLVVPGTVRILMEVGIYVFASYSLAEVLEYLRAPIILVYIYAGLIVLYYIVTYERVLWVLEQRELFSPST